MLALLSLEASRAGLTMMLMARWAVFAAILAVTAWFGLMAAVALWAVSIGITWVAAVSSIALVNLLAAALIMFICLRMSRQLLFPDTRRPRAARLTRLTIRLH